MDDPEQQSHAELMREVIEREYEGLFGFGTQRANDILHLWSDVDEETRRGHMGILALEALSRAEMALSKVLSELPRKVNSQFILGLVEVATNELAPVYRNLVKSGERLLTADYPDNVM